MQAMITPEMDMRPYVLGVCTRDRSVAELMLGDTLNATTSPYGIEALTDKQVLDLLKAHLQVLSDGKVCEMAKRHVTTLVNTPTSKNMSDVAMPYKMMTPQVAKSPRRMSSEKPRELTYFAGKADGEDGSLMPEFKPPPHTTTPEAIKEFWDPSGKGSPFWDEAWIPSTCVCLTCHVFCASNLLFIES